MKKFTYLLATAALLAACSGNQGYTVTGTVEGAADGDTVYLKKVEGRQLVDLESAVIKGGKFTFRHARHGGQPLPHLQCARQRAADDGFLLGKRTNHRQPDAKQ